jgi:hypothetical protein
MMLTAKFFRLFAIAALIAALPTGVGHASQKAAGPAAVSVSAIKVSFKLDPSITRGMYMGDRWVSPPTYSGIQAGKEITVDARVEGLDAGGKLAGASPAWRAEDTDMVRVSPGKGRQVRITVRRAGESALTVTCGKAARELTIKATTSDNVIQVEISQQ